MIENIYKSKTNLFKILLSKKKKISPKREDKQVRNINSSEGILFRSKKYVRVKIKYLYT